MAIGKNKKLKMKKGGKKKIVDPFMKKDWYTIVAPTPFVNRNVGLTCVTRTTGLKVASDGLKGRIFETSLADLNKNEDDAFRKIRLRCEDVQGDKVLTNFYGMDFTRDKLCSLIKKWQTLIEATADVKTTDGYTLRMFCIAFTKKRMNQVKKTCYAQAAQVKNIRAKMVATMTEEASKCDLTTLVQKLIPEAIGKEIEKSCSGIYPLQHCFIRKVKMLKWPKFDLVRLMEMHEGSAEVGKVVEEKVVVEELAGSGGRL